MRILLLSAYDAQSHQYWREGLVAQFPSSDWTQLVLPGRYFSWRIRGNSMQWALGERATLDQPYDLVIATSMVDLASLKGFVPNLAHVPSILYFHENQFIYPLSHSNKKHHLDPKIVTLYGALAADKLLFNSRYNQQSFMSGIKELLNQLPEKMPVDVAQLLDEKSSVLPVPLRSLTDNSHQDYQNLWPKRKGVSPLRLVWAARWEYDKGPQLLQAILRELGKRNIDFQICVLGQKFRKQPIEFEQIKDEFSTQIIQFGYAEPRHHYLSWLAAADIVLSTALHEFQGLAVLEAVQLGCIPVLPNHLVYPELFAPIYLYTSAFNNLPQEASSAVSVIQYQMGLMVKGIAVAPIIKNLEWPAMTIAYDEILRCVRYSRS